ncbi:hypothetical protein ACH5RR_040866 [Cinchona calisaya]|uniref:Zinc knuckle CX2CX4HX4C domain-containing protein n=1 Tax=Cinchona calisaya TaxID=153742 RepID=A0ABD2XSK2_9GENT
MVQYNGASYLISFNYEILALFCFYCGLVGHDKEVCPAKQEDSIYNCLHINQFGLFLRASSVNILEKKDKLSIVNAKSANSTHIAMDEDFGNTANECFDKMLFSNVVVDQLSTAVDIDNGDCRNFCKKSTDFF